MSEQEQAEHRLDTSSSDDNPGAAASNSAVSEARRSVGGLGVALGFIAIVLAVAAGGYSYLQQRNAGNDDVINALTDRVLTLETLLESQQQSIAGLTTTASQLQQRFDRAELPELANRLGALSGELDSVVAEQREVSRDLEQLATTQAGVQPLDQDFLALAALAQAAQASVAAGSMDTAHRLLQAIAAQAQRTGERSVANRARRLASELPLGALQARSQALADLGQQVPSLPLAAHWQGGQTPGEAASRWDGVRNFFAVRVSRNDAPLALNFSGEDRALVNLRLQLTLDRAQLALAQRDTEAYQVALTDARAMVRDYFAPDDGAVLAFNDALAGLAGALPEPPNLDPLLRALQRGPSNTAERDA